MRDNIVQAVVQAPEVIRIQLSVCISMIIKHDFPHKWPQVVDHISIHLETGGDNWLGALTCLYQLVKNYEYKKKEERAPLNDAMNLLLPMIYKIFTGTIQGMYLIILTLIHMGFCSSNLSKNALFSRGQKINTIIKKIV